MDNSKRARSGKPRTPPRDHAYVRSPDLPNALERIRQTASRDKELRFTTLWHHVYDTGRLREAYFGLKRKFHLGPAGTDTSWVEKEKDTNDVYMFFKNRPNTKIVVRNYKLPEPTKPYKTTKGCAQAPVGLGALANCIGNKEKKSWQYLGTHCGNSCALAYGTWFDGHASAGMHHLWVGLGASRAEKENFRKFMDGVKWWFIMQQTHDGSYFNCPNLDRPTGANKNYGPHTMASSNAALILSLPKRVLQITGAE